MTDPLAYNMRAAADAVGVSQRTIEDAVRSGQLQARRLSDKAGSRIGATVAIVAVCGIGAVLPRGDSGGSTSTATSAQAAATATKAAETSASATPKSETKAAPETSFASHAAACHGGHDGTLGGA